ncbi:MAG: glycosyltransferase [Chloroflexota bacterium]|nr:glycosyltransferase [Chloroflexota bacterium]MDE2909254.1 glycosyltransferase [Chloroflexota bacterium]
MISLIATVLNEGDNIHHLFDSIKRQTRRPDEIVIVDGGSSDDTTAIILTYAEELPLRLYVEPGCNISRGRNRAIAEARGDIIAVTDAGVRLTETWLEKVTSPLLDDPTLNVVGGFFLADPQTAFEAALGATTLPLAREINSATFLPSSRSIAFRKSAACDIGGYPEWLDFCEDLVFDLRLRERSGPFAFAPDAIVYFRPRPGLRQFFRQYYLYARGDGKANLWLKRHVIRYLTYFALTPGIFITGALWHPALWLLYLLGAAGYLYQPYRRLPSALRRAPDQSRSVWLYCIVMIPLIRLTGDMAKMIGYPAGWRWRLARRPPDWRRGER